MGTIACTMADGIAVIRFDNPPLGFLDGAMTVALDAALDTLAANPALRVLVLAGAVPGVLIRHFDLAQLAAVAEAEGDAPPPPDRRWDDSIFHRITRKLETLPVPVIAAIDGDCMGVGFELALACDIRIAGEGPWTLGMPEVNIAMCPGGGGTARLARLVGPSRALELIATATVVSPAEALRLGLVNRVVPDALAAAMAMAQAMARLSPGAIAATKRIVTAAPDLSIEDALTLEQREVDARLGSDEVRDVLAAYVATGEDLRRPVDPAALAAATNQRMTRS